MEFFQLCLTNHLLLVKKIITKKIYSFTKYQLLKEKKWKMWWFNQTATAWGRTNNRWCCCYCFYSLTQPIPTNPFLWLLWGKRGGEEGCLVLGFLLGSCWVSFRASYAVFSSWNSLLRILRHFRLIQSLNSMEVLILLSSDSLFFMTIGSIFHRFWLRL